MRGKKVAVLISITSDIGTGLAKRYSNEGYTIVGTYRSTNQLNELTNIPDSHLFFCDLSDRKSISGFVKEYAALGLNWDIFISCPCNPLPLKSFFESNFDEWKDSVQVNVIGQLHILHELHAFRNRNRVSSVVFLAGPGVNNAVTNFSAYAASKIMLIKMCEFLDAENKDMNIFIVGPGWTKTKTHALVLKNVDKNDERYRKTLDFMKNGKGTSMDDIYNCIKWLCGQGKEVSSGRNFSVVNDKWKGPLNAKVASELKSDTDMYKLRRYKNDYLV